MKAIIDTDPGTDDALALIIALSAPDLDVVALTTVGGNARLAHTTRNALRLLAYMGRHEVPVYKGASRPMVGRFQYAYSVHGPGGMTTRLPPTVLCPQATPAANYLVEAARGLRGELTLIVLGPLTNVARAIRREPEFTAWLKQVVVMGGTLETPGNVTPHAEFNFYNDPVAAEVVLSSGVPIRLVGLDVTSRVYVQRNRLPWIMADSANGHLADRVLAGWFRTHPGEDQYRLHDPLAVAAVIQPGLLGYRPANVTVESADPELRGRTTARYGVGPVRVALGIDVAASLSFMRHLLEARVPNRRDGPPT